MERCAGVLCPMFSVPANQGIGDLGQKTVRMIDCIADAGYHVWQILPLQAKGRSHSPYHALSSFAGDPIYINLDRLCEMGLLTQSSITNCNKFKDRVDYETVRVFKNEYFRRAFKAFKKNYDSFKEDFEYFEKTAFWLEDWAVYQLFRSLNSERPWIEWDEEYRNYPLYKEVDLSEYEDELFYTKFLQFIFYKQFDDIVMYAHAREITLISDVAFVNYDSADVWTNRFDFLLDENGNPDENGMAVIGIPEVGNVPAEGFVAGNWSANMLDGITKEDQGANFVYNYIEKQVEPTDPTDPTNPTDPSDKPSDGEDTTKPGNDDPDKDVTSGDDKADVDKNGDKTVETGDESDPAMTATLALLAGGAAIGTGMAIRRKRED